jgi:large subunit ribosomal protein L14e
MFEIGRICMKTAGREAGRFCVVVAKEKEKDFVLITGPRAATLVRRRKCNLDHLEPTPFKLDIKENATDEQLLELYDKEKLYEKLRITKPGAAPLERRHKEEPKEEKREIKHEEKAEKKEEHKEAKHEEHKKEAAEKKHEETKEHKAEHKKEAKAEKPRKARAKKPAAKRAKKE